MYAEKQKGVIFFYEQCCFQGHSTLILSPKLYEEASDVSKQAYRKLTTSNKCNLINGKVYTSLADAKEIAVIVRNEKNGILKHIPTMSNCEEAIKNVLDTIDTLKKTAKGKLTAWIIGGDSVNGAGGNDTVKTLDKVAGAICDRTDIDTSILVGSKSGEDKFFLHTLNGELEVGLDKNPRAIRQSKLPIEEKLENYFDIIELNNTDVKLD